MSLCFIKRGLAGLGEDDRLGLGARGEAGAGRDEDEGVPAAEGGEAAGEPVGQRLGAAAGEAGAYAVGAPGGALGGGGEDVPGARAIGAQVAGEAPQGRAGEQLEADEG